MTDAPDTGGGNGDLHPAFNSPAPATSSRPEWLPESSWDASANSVKVDSGLRAVFERDSAARAAKAQLPARPDDYTISLPSDFTLPDGSGFAPEQLQINADDPRIPMVRAFAHKHGLSQAAVSELVALDAQMQIQNYNAETARLTDENKKLGDRAEDRVKAVAAWAEGMQERGEIGRDELDAVMGIATTAAGIVFLEKMIGKANGNIPGHQHDNRQRAPGSIDGYERMSFEQKRVAQWAAAQGRQDG